MSVAAHPDRPFGLEDLLAAPEDGYRYEVIDGALVVNAAPSWRHQEICLNLAILLRRFVPEELVVLPAPVWRIGPQQIPEPDVVVVPRRGLGRVAVEGVPVLVVEVLSASNRGSDLVRKRALYADAGCRHYWIVDPEGPKVTTLTLTDSGDYAERSVCAPGERLVASEPFELSFDPAEL